MQQQNTYNGDGYDWGLAGEVCIWGIYTMKGIHKGKGTQGTDTHRGYIRGTDTRGKATHRKETHGEEIHTREKHTGKAQGGTYAALSGGET